MVLQISRAAGGLAPLRSLAEASGKDLEYVVRLANRGELRKLFTGGRKFYIRKVSDEPDNNTLAHALARRASPRQAQLRLMGKRFGPSS